MRRPDFRLAVVPETEAYPVSAGDRQSEELATTVSGAARGRERLVLFAIAFVAYATVGGVLVFVFHSMMGDAVARVANASYVLYSRDPHLGAMGFVWPPLPTVVLLPLIPLKALFPVLTSRGFASNLMSAAFMAGAVVQIYAALVDRGASRRAALALTTAFALHPMIIFYGANGMTEAPFIFFLVLAARSLVRWTETSELRPLVVTGVALGCAYLTRYEAIAAGFAAIAFVMIVTFLRARQLPDRRHLAVIDGAIVGGPLLFAIAAWAAVSWVIVGSPFPEFSSAYGNSSYVTLDAGVRTAAGATMLTRQIFVLEPLLVIVVLAATIAAVRRRSIAPAAVVVVVGSALGFQALAFLADQTYGFFRYYILVVPLTIMLAGWSLAQRPRQGSRLWKRLLAASLSLLAFALVIPGVASSGIAMADKTLAPQEHVLRAIVEPRGMPLAARRRLMEPFTVERKVAAYLDPLGLPRGSVLVDVAFGFPIVLASERPKQFVIPSDRDFLSALQAPDLFHISYVLVIPDDGLGKIDAVNRAYPSLYTNGAGIGTLVREFTGAGPTWRLYRVAA